MKVKIIIKPNDMLTQAEIIKVLKYLKEKRQLKFDYEVKEDGE